MNRLTKLMPNPSGVFTVLVTPFFLFVSGVALFLTLVPMKMGADLIAPTNYFFTGPTSALLPLAVFLVALWLFYLVVYVLAGAYGRDLWAVARMPDRLAGLLRRHCLFSGPTPAVCLVAPLSLVRLHRLYRPARPAAAWRAGDSVQLE